MNTDRMKTRVICVNTGDKYSQWYTDNLKYMIDKYSELNYDEFCIIDEEKYGDVYDKLQMFDRYRDGQNIFFDLDVLIKGNCNSFLRKDLHVCHAWWRKAYHTPLNSSIISWQGDYSHIYEKFDDQSDYYMLKYHLGIDQYLYEIFNPKTFSIGFCSVQTIEDEQDYNVYFFNQRYERMSEKNWWTNYFLQDQ